MVRGPHGKSFLAVLADFVTAVTQPRWFDSSTILGNFYRRCGRIREIGDNRVTYYATALFSRSSTYIRWLHNQLLANPQLKKIGYPRLGRLTTFDEVGGKKRYIALGNWIVQGSLRPLHDIIIMYLRGNPCDCTYDQDKVFRWYSKITSRGHKDFWSLDLSAATDRLPLSLQQRILEVFLRKGGYRDASDVACT
jgi:hypothetical protein